jgi:hypothetical protein
MARCGGRGSSTALSVTDAQTVADDEACSPIVWLSSIDHTDDDPKAARSCGKLRVRRSDYPGRCPSRRRIHKSKQTLAIIY